MHKGYGLLYYKGKTTRAHKLSYELTHGKVPAGLHVLHKCDTPTCVNPEHLYLGTNIDNIKDKVQRNRSLKGERNPAAKLSFKQIKAIRNDNRPQRVVAKEYAVSQTTVHKIKAGKTWA